MLVRICKFKKHDFLFLYKSWKKIGWCPPPKKSSGGGADVPSSKKGAGGGDNILSKKGTSLFTSCPFAIN
jgi:hypothetical protein